MTPVVNAARPRGTAREMASDACVGGATHHQPTPRVAGRQLNILLAKHGSVPLVLLDG
jgi:hypothetical protein